MNKSLKTMLVTICLMQATGILADYWDERVEIVNKTGETIDGLPTGWITDKQVPVIMGTGDSYVKIDTVKGAGESAGHYMIDCVSRGYIERAQHRICTIYHIKDKICAPIGSDVRGNTCEKYYQAAKIFFTGGVGPEIPGIDLHKGFDTAGDFANAVWKLDGYSGSGANKYFVRAFCDYVNENKDAQDMLNHNAGDYKWVTKYKQWCNVP
jgi:hypothetical protein